ncbi:peptidoglycan-binding protein [Streptomyces sp. NEAU-NA10]|uniref:peptidoglycan-binding domain-containing protein n=1 Tax=Streptomyces sp. NEAU-NA10 TaxID=3416050 RepID=UPI003CC64DBA
MNEPTGRQGRPGQHGLPCPECGALRAPDNTPSCTCAQRASEALRDTREAEAAAAGDFDPLRIRPYVELGEQEPDAGTGDAAPSDVTAPLPAVSDATMPLRAVHPSGPAPETAALPTPVAPVGSPPAAADLSLFEAGDSDGGVAYADGKRPRGRRRRTLLIASAAAAVAVIAAAGFAGGLLSYEKPTRDGAAPEDVRAAVPDTSTAPASPSNSSAAPSPSESESASPSPSERESPSPSPSESESASPSASATTEPSPSAPTAGATGSAAPGKGPDNAADNAAGSSPAATVLRRGDRGDEVTELQVRLKQIFLYNDEVNGVFSSRVEEALRNYQWSRGVQGDELGVYGAATREKLESETKEP